MDPRAIIDLTVTEIAGAVQNGSLTAACRRCVSIGTRRPAIAHAFVCMQPATVRAIRGAGKARITKGNPLEIARIAGIAAAKRTSELIPLCHPLALTHVDVRCQLCQNGVEVTSEATATGPTGVEMEALTAASVAALTIYDMCKAVERGITIERVYLVKKTGGKSGTYKRGKKG